MTLLFSCTLPNSFKENFDSINNRTWVNENFWTIPIENWKVQDGRLECNGKLKNMKTVLLTHMIDEEGEFLINLRMGVPGEVEGLISGGLIIAIQDDTDMDIRSLSYFGKGLNAGVDTHRQLFLGDLSIPLPDDFDLSDFSLQLDGLHDNGKIIVRLQATDEQGITSDIIEKDDIESFAGAIALTMNHLPKNNDSTESNFWFDDFNLAGSAVVAYPDNSFGPILWSMYTLSNDILKLTAQMPPLGVNDNHYLELHLKENSTWTINQSVKIDPQSRTALFRVENWDSSLDHDYKLVYHEKTKDGKEIDHIRQGIIRKDPVDKELVMAAMTGTYFYGFPYRPLAENLKTANPDLLFFSGDQIYELNGGYPIVRFPADAAILNYLGKWYMFGWAFGELMKDRPTIGLSDDHDIFQGNLWGAGGADIPQKVFKKYHGTSGGYVEPAAMVNVVHRTQSSNLPDPYDPSLMEQGITPYYTELVYGNVSFAIVGDRTFKSGPNKVAYWKGRQDWIKKPIKDLSRLDPPGLKLLGDRQMSFIKNWAQNWTGAKMKCLLSQTIFSNIATHHGGNKTVLFADLDSGGWPITPRNKAVEVMRSCFAFHVAGDQHLSSMIQYGIKDFRDAGWAYCTPAITVGYQRRFQPEKLGLAISDPPEHHLPNTGKYRDPFGHPTYVYAVGNPADETADPNRYIKADKCSSGFGLIHFDTDTRKIKTESIRFLANLSDRDNPDNQLPGWPLTIDQLDNYGRKKIGYLKDIELDPEKEYIQLYSEKSGNLVYALRPDTSSFSAFVFEKGKYTIRIVNDETGNIRQEKGLEIIR